MYDRSNDPTMEQVRRTDGSLRVITKSGKTSRTKQSFKEECDINNIVRKAEKQGQLPLRDRVAQYGDFSNVPSYQESLEVVRKAEEQFLLVGSRIRARFNNNPEEFLAFASDPRNGEEMVRLGLAMKSSPLPTRGGTDASPEATSTTTKASKKTSKVEKEDA